MGKKIDSIALKNRMIYRAEFDTVPDDTDTQEDDYYDEIVYYDGGGVEGYGNSKKN